MRITSQLSSVKLAQPGFWMVSYEISPCKRYSGIFRGVRKPILMLTSEGNLDVSPTLFPGSLILPPPGASGEQGAVRYIVFNILRCVSLAVVFDFSPFFIFQVWLIRSLLRSNVQSSRIFVHGFAVYLVCKMRDPGNEVDVLSNIVVFSCILYRLAFKADRNFHLDLNMIFFTLNLLTSRRQTEDI